MKNIKTTTIIEDMSESTNGTTVYYNDGSSVCFVCNVVTTFGTRISLDIFNEKVTVVIQQLKSPKLILFNIFPQTKAVPIADTLSTILRQRIESDTAHTRYICKKCKKLCAEHEELSNRLHRIELEIIQNFNSTATKYGINPVPASITTNLREKIGIEAKVKSIQIDDPINAVAVSLKSSDEISTIATTILSRPNDEDELLALDSFDPNNYDIVECDADDVELHNEMQTENLAHNFLVDGKEVMIVRKVRLQYGHTTDTPTFSIETEDVDDAEFMHDDNVSVVTMAAATNEPDVIVPPVTSATGDDPKEYFDSNDGNMVEISTEHEFNELQSNENSDNNSMSYDTGICFVEMKNDGTYTIESNIKSKSNDPLQDGRPIFMRDGVNFVCNLCEEYNETVYNVRSMAFHMKTQHEEKVIICDVCGADFRRRNEMSEHLVEHAQDQVNRKFKCEDCDRVFDHLRVFRMHKRIHYNKTKSWECEECNKKYGSKNLLDEHMNMHTGERPYKCVQCSKDFASKYTLTAHMKIHSERKRPYQCNICPKSFFSPQNLAQHERTHTGVKEFICNVCNKAFGTLHNLDVHKIVHTGYKPFICRTCGKAFARRAEIKDHERIHTGERPFVCDICSASFSQRSNLMSHKRATHLNEKRYKCDICSKSFKRRRLMEYHKKAMHTGERPYKCEQCSATFVYPEHFKKHCRIHSGEKPYKCEVCGKAFNSRDNRNAHRFVHSGKKPYECVYCNQGFMRKPLLLAHMEQMNHKNEVIITNHAQISNFVEFGDEEYGDGGSAAEGAGTIKSEFSYAKGGDDDDDDDNDDDDDDNDDDVFDNVSMSIILFHSVLEKRKENRCLDNVYLWQITVVLHLSSISCILYRQ